MEMGNFGFPKMSFGFSYHNSNSSEDSESDSSYSERDQSESEESPGWCEDSDASSPDKCDATFDSVPRVPKKKYHSCYAITFEDVKDIEVFIDFKELISLIFLLFDDTRYALQVIRSLIAAGPENFSRTKLSEWASTSPEHWKFKLFEALAITQIFNELSKLGLCREDINIMKDAPLYINKYKHLLFLSVCDFLEREQANKLIESVRCDAKFEDDITLKCDPMYIEFHVLFWISQGYIKIEGEPNLDNLTKHLKGNTSFMILFENLYAGVAVSFKNTSTNSDESNNLDDEESYQIKDPLNPGLVLIINNANFKNNIERRKEYQHLRPNSRLSDRKSSNVDAQNLRKTFRRLNYDVFVLNDVFHDKLVEEIYQTVGSKFEVGRHSVLVLCILSHGDKGVIFGANSIPLKKKEIINSVCGSSRLVGLLADIPKVIIIQACQGKNFIYAEPEPELLVPDGAVPDVADGNIKTDGHDSFDPTKLRDKVVCTATIKGFVALRGVMTGSPYIQELCRCIEKYHAEKHFCDIMTKVHQKLSKDKCIVKQEHEKRHMCMIPEINSTLSKSLYLTKKHHKRGWPQR